MSDDKKPSCSFCGKVENEVERVICGPSVQICNECVDLCAEIINEEAKDAESGGTKQTIDAEYEHSNKPPSAQDIISSLDCSLVLNLTRPDVFFSQYNAAYFALCNKTDNVANDKEGVAD